MADEQWAKELIQDIHKDLRKTWGPGWELLSEHQRQTEIRSLILSVVFAQSMEEYKPAVELISNMLRAAFRDRENI